MTCVCYGITGGSNQYVSVIFEPAKNIAIVIKCIFLNQRDNTSTKSCNIEYGQCTQGTLISANGTNNGSNIVIIKLEHLDMMIFCYKIRASNETFTILLVGMYEEENSKSCQTMCVYISFVLSL